MTSTHSPSPAPPQSSEIFAPPDEPSYRWVMLGLIWFLYFSFGMVSSSIAPLLSDIKQDLNLNDALLGTALGAWPFVYIFAAIPAATAIEKFGLRRALAAAGVIIALSQMLRAVAVDHVTLTLAIAVFGLGGPLVSIGAPATVARWFGQRERPIALGIYSTAPALGAVIALYTSNAIVMPLTNESWRTTLLIFGSFAVCAAVLWTLFARERPAQDSREEPSKQPSERQLRRFFDLAKVPTVQLILVMGVAIFMMGHGVSNWLPELLRREGMSKQDAGLWAAIPTIVGIVWAIVLPGLLRRRPGSELPALAMIFVVEAIAIALVPFASGFSQAVGLVLLGLGRGVIMPLIMLTLMSLPSIGSRNMGIAGGLYFTAGEMGGVLGPTLVGIIASLYSLAAGFYMLAGVSALLFFMTLVLQRQTSTAKT